jgi:hypothetical protein
MLKRHPDHWACEVSMSHLFITERSGSANAKAQSRWLVEKFLTGKQNVGKRADMNELEGSTND